MFIEIEEVEDVRTRSSLQRPTILWLTGLSGSGKTTTARALEYALVTQGYRVVVIDGDELRRGLC